MSIRGIDTQIMINRTAEFSKDASAMMKRPEVQQEFLAAQQKVSDAQAQGKVLQTQESEMENIRTDVDGGGLGGGGGEGAEPDEDEKKGDSARAMLVPPGNNVIDITI